MLYADSDFFLALTIDGDRLHAAAKREYERHRGNIRTSLAAVLEILLISKRFGGSPMELVSCIMDTAKIDLVDEAALLLAAHYIEDEHLSVFDAFHAALCGGEIISSDHVYDRLGISRIGLGAGATGQRGPGRA